MTTCVITVNIKVSTLNRNNSRPTYSVGWVLHLCSILPVVTFQSSKSYIAVEKFIVLKVYYLSRRHWLQFCDILCKADSFIHSFGHFYSAPSSPLLLRGEIV